MFKGVYIAVSIFLLAKQITALIDSCLTYSTLKPSGQEICTRCKDGYNLAKDQFSCKICPLGCSQCDEDSNCLTCKNGTYMENMICHSCTQACNQCDAAQCYECLFGFSLVNTTCIQCPDNCLNCTNNTFCVNCLGGYDLVAQKNGSTTCQIDKDITTKGLAWFLIGLLIIAVPFLCCIYIYNTVLKEARHTTRFGIASELNEAYGEDDIKQEKKQSLSKFEKEKQAIQSPRFEKKARQPLTGVVPLPPLSPRGSANGSSFSQLALPQRATASSLKNSLRNSGIP